MQWCLTNGPRCLCPSSHTAACLSCLQHLPPASAFPRLLESEENGIPKHMPTQKKAQKTNDKPLNYRDVQSPWVWLAQQKAYFLL